MNYIRYIKKAYQILPEKYKVKTGRFLALSFFNLLLELFSLAIVIPLIIMIVDRDAFAGSGFLGSLLQNAINQRPLYLAAFLLLAIVIFIVKNGFIVRIIRYQTKTCFRIASDISVMFTRHYLQHDFASFSRQAKSETIRNSIEVPNEFVVYVLLAINTILSESLLLLLIFLAGLTINPVATLLLLLLFALAILVAHNLGKKKIRRINDSLGTDYAGNVANLMNMLNGFFEIRSYGKEEWFLSRFKQSNDAVNRSYATLYAENLVTPKYIEVVIVAIIGFIVLLYTAMPASAQGDLLYISFLAAAAMKVIPSANKIITGVKNFNSHLFTIDAIETQLTEKAAEDTDGKNHLAFNDCLRLQQLAFSYDENPLLQGVNLRLRPGEVVAIYGKSGAGKSTLLHIIAQLIERYDGQISVDDTAVNPSNKTRFLKMLAYVPQEPFIMEGTVRDNILLGRGNDDVQRLEKLVNDLELEAILSRLPEGLDTFIGNNGYRLSGGQKQRIALLRALWHRPRILLLDEATNQLEQNLEKRILQHIKKIAAEQRISVILVSHHIENARDISDRVYELTDGVLVERL